MSRIQRLKHSLVRNRSHLISIAGALLVFLTFVAKEGYAEKLKDEANAIDLAFDVYSIKADTLEVLKKIGEVSAKISSNAPAGKTPPDSDAMTWMVKLLNQSMDPQVQAIRPTMDNIVALLDRLPGDLSDAGALKAIKAELQENRREFYDLSKTYFPKGTASEEISEAQAHELYTKAQPINQRMFHLSLELDDLFSRVMKRAEERRKQIEHDSNHAWWWAAVFFGIGSLVALIGQLYGVPVGEAG